MAVRHSVAKRKRGVHLASGVKMQTLATSVNATGVAIDAEGNTIIVHGHTITKVAPNGCVSTLAGSAGNAGLVDGPAATARFQCLVAVAIDAHDNIIVAQGADSEGLGSCIRKMTSDGTVSTVVGSNEGVGGWVDGPADSANFVEVLAMAIDSESNIVVVDTNEEGQRCIRKITVNGTGAHVSSLLTPGTAHVDSFYDVAIDADGNIILSDCCSDDGNVIRKLAPDGSVSLLQISCPEGDELQETGHHMACDSHGNVIVADDGEAGLGSRIRKIARDGVMTTLAQFDTHQRTAAYGLSVAIDTEGDVVVCLAYSKTVLKLTGCGLGRGLALPRWAVGPPQPALGQLMLTQGLFTDVTFSVQGTKMAAHKAVLAARSEYFERMFSPQFVESELEVVSIGNTTPQAFQRVLDFLYTDSLELSDDIVIDVMIKAKELRLTRAYNLCMRYCVRQATAAQVMGWLARAKESQLEDLTSAMVTFVSTKFASIRQDTPELLRQLCEHQDVMMDVLCSVELNTSSS